jgi:UDPglucose 6-dehydrogenase
MTVIGCGHLGAAHAAAMAEIGHEVMGLDVDERKIAALGRGHAGFQEPGLDGMLSRHLASGRLSFGTDFAAAGAFGEVHFLAVATPGKAQRGDYDLSQVFSAVRSLASHLSGPCLIVGKSTVPVGTTAVVRELARELAPAGDGVDVAWNPEFLREGHAVRDTLRPDRIVVGLDSPAAEATIRNAYKPITDAGVPLIITDPATCELTKGAANAFLAMKISFINAMADVCEAAGGNVDELADTLGLDPRIGRAFLNAGIGYGGGCLPKDTRAFAVRARELGADRAADLLGVVSAINVERRQRVTEMVAKACGGELQGRRVGLWGAAFKPGTDDIRDSPGLDVAARLIRQGATVAVYDPSAMDNARAICPELSYSPDPLSAAAGADVLVIATGCDEFSGVDPRSAGAVAASRTVIDAAHVIDVRAWERAGWAVRVLGLGRAARD